MGFKHGISSRPFPFPLESRQPQFLFIYLFSFIPGFGNLRENLNFDSNVFSVFKIKKNYNSNDD